VAATEIGWTASALRDVSMALSVSLGRVPQGSVVETDIAVSWQKVQDWLRDVQKLTARPDDAFVLNQVPPFPLTSRELQALQVSIDRIAQARAAASATRVGPTTRHLRRSIRRTMFSAYGLGVVLLACAAIPVIDLAVLHGARSAVYFGLSFGTSLVAIVAWAFHYSRPGTHKAMLEETHPLP